MDETIEQWCERVYREVGVTPALREAYEFYLRWWQTREGEDG